MVIPAAFQMQTVKSGTTHFSPWMYDRHVPLAFYGGPFTPGIYHGRVQPVDLAATLASLLGVNPAVGVGRHASLPRRFAFRRRSQLRAEKVRAVTPVRPRRPRLCPSPSP